MCRRTADDCPSVNIALQAMYAAAERDRHAAKAANAKSALLHPTSPETEDPNIVAALAAARRNAPRRRRAGCQPRRPHAVPKLTAHGRREPGAG
jgi:hypothetical protein